ncbi:GDSL-type esterase/lipase family protein [Frondihabitans australicus]|uniref:Lysophospholipase L1-like esterase n=1 Tax=Frondihabitans australicus TaxID=386892 RepID=A0A495IIV6_9MICO|nr:GDSL-type esterase/lipase family protein [Frondihabitans australicus]RKR75338.1 lysophospholipase L1-like esterase [Frondihabitans australicus]
MKDTRCCFVGDSLVVGVGDSSGLGWVGRIGDAATAAGIPFTTYNLGVRGDTTAMVGDRILREIEPRLAAATDARVVLSVGVNDTVEVDGLRRASLDESLIALEGIIAAIAPAGLLVVGPPAVDDDEQNERIDELSRAFARRCDERGVPFVGVYAATAADEVWRGETRDGDGFHPDAAGYARLAALVERSLLDWLRS